MNILLYKEFADIHLKNKKYGEGDIVLIETVGDGKITSLKETVKGKLFIEAMEVQESEDVIIVELKEFSEDNIIKIPTFEDLIDILMNKGYEIIFKKDKRIIKKDDIIIIECEHFEKETLMELILNKKKCEANKDG